jgi:hypothetical protein
MRKIPICGSRGYHKLANSYSNFTIPKSNKVYQKRPKKNNPKLLLTPTCQSMQA